MRKVVEILPEPGVAHVDGHEAAAGLDVILVDADADARSREVHERIAWMRARLRGRRALEIGCGQGALTLALAQAGVEVTGVDVDPEAIAAAKRRLGDVSPEDRSRIRLLVGDAGRPDFLDEVFDTVFIGDVAQHAGDPAALVRAVAERVAPGGALALMTPLGYSPSAVHQRAFDMQTAVALLPEAFSVVSLEVLHGVICLHAEHSEAVSKRPSAADLLELSSAAFIEEQKAFHDTIASYRRLSLNGSGRIPLQLAHTPAGVDLAKAQNDIESARGQLRRLQRRLDARRREIRALRRSTTFQAGLALRLALRRPFPNFFMLFYRFWTLARGRRLDLSDPFKSGLSDPFRSGKAEADGPTALTRRATEEVRRLRAAGDTKAELAYLKREAASHPTEGILRALYWAAMRGGAPLIAYETVKRLEKTIGPEPTAEQRDLLERLHRSPAMNLSVLDEIEAPRAPEFQPVEGRVAYVLHNSLPYSSGGYATRAHGLAMGVAATGREMACITRPGYPLDLVGGLDAADLPMKEVIDGVAYHRTLGLSYAGGGGGISYILPAARLLEKTLASQRPSCVIAASAHMTALPALIAARRLGLPFIYEVRGFWEITRLSREPEYAETVAFKVARQLEGEVASRADHVLTLTEPMKEELVARGVSAERITLAPNSCDVSRFTPRGRDETLAARLGIPADVPVIGYIGTFVQYEGLEHLAAACARLRARGEEFRLLLVGNENASGLDRGPITEEIARIAREEGLGDWVIMPGRIPHEEVEDYYSLIDIAPFPRKPQPVTEMVSPMKPLEALAMEKAVVVSSVRALTGMIADGETGLVFEKGNIDSLAKVLARLIDDSALRARLGRAGRAWVETERTWEKTALTVAGVVDAVIAAAPALASEHDSP